MNFDVIGFHPDNVFKIALDIYDKKDSVEEKVKTLLNSRAIKNLNSVDLPKNFQSGKTIDLNAGELLGLGAIVSYYQWSSDEAGTGNTYQAVVGVEDSAKNEVENLLSDGALWHDQTRKKMTVQQVLVQGYFPVKTISNDDVIAAIQKKMLQRESYPENCILIVNLFGESVSIDRQAIYAKLAELDNSFTDIFVVTYNLPTLTIANVSYISEPGARGLNIVLKRYEHEAEWRVNLDGKVYPKS